MNREMNNQTGVKESSAGLTSAGRYAAGNEALRYEWESLCEECEESNWNDCRRCVAKLNRLIEGMSNTLNVMS